MKTHLRNFFLARWWASRPSDSVLSDCSGTSVRALSPPNHRTITLSLLVTGPTSLPGHAGKPRAAPHTRSPSQRPPDPPTLSVCAITVKSCSNSHHRVSNKASVTYSYMLPNHSTKILTDLQSSNCFKSSTQQTSFLVNHRKYKQHKNHSGSAKLVCFAKVEHVRVIQRVSQFILVWE